MNKKEETNSIVANGGWKKTKVRKTKTIYGFQHYLIWEIFIVPLWIFLIILHMRTNENVFTLENTGVLVWVGLLAQIFFIYKLFRTYGTKTRTETKTHIIEVSNPDYDSKNLY